MFPLSDPIAALHLTLIAGFAVALLLTSRRRRPARATVVDSREQG